MKQAYVSLMCGGDAYEPGAEALGRSLRATGTKIPLVLMVTPDVSSAARARLATSAGWEPRGIEALANPSADGELLFTRFRNTYTKLRAFGLEDIEKVVFLDADTLVLQNIDELFDRPAFAAAPDFFLPNCFNSGVMVIEPSRALYESMESMLHRRKTYDGGDQGFLNEYYPDWWSMDVGHRLEARYNLHHFVFQFMTAHSSVRSVVKDVKIVHYTLQKPWLHPTVTGASEIWWNRYLEQHPELDGRLRRRLHALQDWTFDSLVGALGGT
jgi:alpha-N-acetylglucosamine transferase